MDNNVYKRHLFEVYSSDEEEIEDINELQEEFESEREENCPMFGLEVEDLFEDWDSAERQVESYAKETGFEVKKSRLEKNNKGEIVRRTFMCKFSGKYRAQKRVTRECKEGLFIEYQSSANQWYNTHYISLQRA